MDKLTKMADKNKWTKQALFSGFYEQFSLDARGNAQKLVDEILHALISNPKSLERLLLARNGQEVRAQDWFSYFLEVWTPSLQNPIPPGSPTDEMDFPELEAYKDDETRQLHWRPVPNRSVGEGESSPTETVILDIAPYQPRPSSETSSTPALNIPHNEILASIQTVLIDSLPTELQAPAQQLILRLLQAMTREPYVLEWLLRARQGSRVRTQDLFMYVFHIWKDVNLRKFATKMNKPSGFLEFEPYVSDSTGTMHWRPIRPKDAPKVKSSEGNKRQSKEPAQPRPKSIDNKPGPSSGAVPLNFRPPPQIFQDDSSSDNDDDCPKPTKGKAPTPLRVKKSKPAKKKPGKPKKHKSKEMISTDDETTDNDNDMNDGAPTPKSNRAGKNPPRQLFPTPSQQALGSSSTMANQSSPTIVDGGDDAAAPKPIRVKRVKAKNKGPRDRHVRGASESQNDERNEANINDAAPQLIRVKRRRRNEQYTFRIKNSKRMRMARENMAVIKTAGPKANIKGVKPRRTQRAQRPSNSNQRASERPRIQCTEEGCEATFTRPANMRRHVVEQHGTKERFRCKVCGAEYGLKRERKEHFKVEHAKKRGEYPCTVCGKIYFRRQALYSHMHHRHAASSGTGSETESHTQ